MLALPIDGYNKYTTEEMLLAYAYILMAYLSIAIYFLSFLCERRSHLQTRLENQTSIENNISHAPIDNFPNRNDVQFDSDSMINQNDHQPSNQDLDLELYQSDEFDLRRQSNESESIHIDLRQIEEQNQYQDLSIFEDSLFSNRDDRFIDNANDNSQHSSDVYQPTTLEQCKIDN